MDLVPAPLDAPPQRDGDRQHKIVMLADARLIGGPAGIGQTCAENPSAPQLKRLRSRAAPRRTQLATMQTRVDAADQQRLAHAPSAPILLRCVGARGDRDAHRPQPGGIEHVADSAADAALVNDQIAAIAQRWPSEQLADMGDNVWIARC